MNCDYGSATALGIHIGHDRGACVIADGRVAAAISQERIDGIKYSQSSKLPYDSIDAVLKEAGLGISDIACVGLSFVAADGERLRDYYCSEFFGHYEIPYVPFYWAGHHDAHAYCAFYSSGFDEALVFVSDGGGDFIGKKQESESLYVGRNGSLVQIDRRMQDLCIRHMREPINHIYPFMPESVQRLELSLGRKYAQITHLLGFGFGEAGKTMGLASYGSPLFDVKRFLPTSLNFSLTYTDLVKDIFIQQELSGLSYREFIERERGNIAATVQEFTEQALMSLIDQFSLTYGNGNICLVGGIFLNCLTNHRIVKSANFQQVFIPPCAGDDGQALGAAYYALVHRFGPLTKGRIETRLPFLGLSHSDEEIENAINAKGLRYSTVENISERAKRVASFIADNKIVALHQGRTEIGPRALCHRSILANPGNPEMKDILNKRVKRREPFRPFAPTVSAERQFDYFDLAAESKYMLLATTVKESYRAALPSVTHVDGTARIQSVRSADDPFMHAVLENMEKLTGHPVVLNTSLNVAGKPIVESPTDALNTFLGNDIDVLVIGKFILEKKR